MASKSEESYGARLLRANNLLSYISNFTNYAPPRAEEKVADFGNLLQVVATANATESSLKQNYNTAVTNRHKSFRTETNSIFKLLPPIRAAVEAQYGKKSTEFNQIDSIVKNIRNSKIIHIAATETTPESTISRSEQSYGSTTQYFNNLINTLTQFHNYSPSNINIQIATLQAFATQIDSLNTQVASTYQALRSSKATRNTHYADLSDRVSRIKAYVKANYGVQSQEYTLIKGLSV